MEIEEGQAQVIQKFVNKASTLETTSSLANLIVEATSHPSLFAFSEILSLPNILQLQGTEDSAYIDLLRLFGYGTWRDYKGNSAMLPKLSQDQILKLKQLTVLTLSETNKVQFAAERDLMHGQLGSMIDTLGNWLATSDNVLSLIEEKIDCASKMCQLNMDHQQELQGRIDEGKKNIHFKKSQHKQDLCFLEYGDGFDFLGGPMEHEEDLMRSKRRRSPHSYRRRRSLYP